MIINSPGGIKVLQSSLKYCEQYGYERGELEDTGACIFFLQLPRSVVQGNEVIQMSNKQKRVAPLPPR